MSQLARLHPQESLRANIFASLTKPLWGCLASTLEGRVLLGTKNFRKATIHPFYYIHQC